MRKPRKKTREELTAEIEDGKKKIRQFENRKRCYGRSYPKRNAGHTATALSLGERSLNRGEWVDKTTKTTSSTRDIIIPMEIAQRIREQGYVFKGHPNSITDLQTTEDRLGIPRFTMHKLRHYFASKMSAMNIPDADGRMGDGLCNEICILASMMQKDETAKRTAAVKLQNALLG